MYPDEKQRKDHLLDFKKVLCMIEQGTKSNERDYRIRILKENIERCSD
jgi:hypothetical protein